MFIRWRMFVAFALTASAILCVVAAIENRKPIKIGVIFDKDDGNVLQQQMKRAWRFAIERFNFGPQYYIEPHVQHLDASDSFKLANIACDMIGDNVTAIVTIGNDLIVESIVERFEIPLLQVNQRFTSLSPERTIFNFYPSVAQYGRALCTLVKEMRWKSFVVLYEHHEGLIRLQQLLAMVGNIDRSSVHLRKLHGSDHRQLLKEIKDASHQQIILDCRTEHVIDILQQAYEVNLMDEYYSYVLTALDAHTLDFGAIKPFTANVTTLRMLDPSAKTLRNVVRDWEFEDRDNSVGGGDATRRQIVHDSSTVQYVPFCNDIFLIKYFFMICQTSFCIKAVEFGAILLICNYSIFKLLRLKWLLLIKFVSEMKEMKTKKERRLHLKMCVKMHIKTLQVFGEYKNFLDPALFYGIITSGILIPLIIMKGTQAIDVGNILHLLSYTFLIIMYSMIGEVLQGENEALRMEIFHSICWSDIDVAKDMSLMMIFCNNTVTLSAGFFKEFRTPIVIGTSSALIYDALSFFTTVFIDLDATESIEHQSPILCDGATTYKSGMRLSDYAKVRPLFNGSLLPGPLTGPIIFNQHGERINYTLQIVEVMAPTKDGAVTIRQTAEWRSQEPDRLHYKFSQRERQLEIEQQLSQKVFRVASRLGAPYLMWREPKHGERLRDNQRFEGYSIDLISAIADELNFTYRFELVPDNNYGSYDPKTKQWNGLIKQLLDRKADLAVCDLTITYERRKAVDFTMPFMTLGISILYSKAVKPPPDLFSFMHPLSLDIWLYMATAYLAISIVIYVAARCAPSDWENPHPCDRQPTELENIWSIKNCLWLTLGSLMAQGCDILPKGASTRMIAAMWWFFSLIMCASYTANLAAFLTMERMGPTIENAEDLAKQTKIKYGCVNGGATASFFKDSNFSTHHRMWTQMEAADPAVFERSNKEGVKRVKTSKRAYAFLMESSSIEYELERDCELMQVGAWLDTKGYGIAMPVNSPYRTAISGAVLKMQEDGKLHKLKEKWWKRMHGGGQCSAKKHRSDETTAELGISNVGGIFVLLFGGIIIAFLIAIGEFVWHVRKQTIARRSLCFKSLLIEELKCAFAPHHRQAQAAK